MVSVPRGTVLGPFERDEWLEERKRGIGGSDIAAILGLSSFTSAYEVYCSKLPDAEERNPSDIMDMGQEIEPWTCGWQNQHPVPRFFTFRGPCPARGGTVNRSQQSDRREGDLEAPSRPPENPGRPRTRRTNHRSDKCRSGSQLRPEHPAGRDLLVLLGDFRCFLSQSGHIHRLAGLELPRRHLLAVNHRELSLGHFGLNRLEHRLPAFLHVLQLLVPVLELLPQRPGDLDPLPFRGLPTAL